MFTGIIEEVGRVSAIERRGAGSRIRISAQKVLEGTQVGDSIATNGVCLTVSALMDGAFAADVMPETISRTSFVSLRPGSSVNLERAAVVGGRIGGHIVSGHIDGVGTIASIKEDSDAVRLSVDVSSVIADGIVEKGSVALEGISLTVTDISPHTFGVSLIPHTFGVSLIPHTFANTSLGTKRVGDAVNVECDVLGKYVFRAVGLLTEQDGNAPSAQGGLTLQALQEMGF